MSLTTTHPDYALMLPEMQKIRAAVKGAFFVKKQGYLYLPHPSDVDQTSDKAVLRYIQYRHAAEFDEVPGYTMRSMVGRAALHKSVVEMPAGLESLKENIDGDGLSLLGQAESVFTNITQLKWHLLVAEYINSPRTGERLTPAEIASRNVRPAIKSYPRDAVLDWDFRTINGINQLAYLKLMEHKRSLDYATGSRTEYDEYLIMYLDSDGNYYWRKETSIGDKGEDNQVTVNKQPLKWLPVEIVADMEPETGQMPQEMGFLSPIVDKVMSRYVDSARYAEGRLSILPTLNTTGWQGNDWDDFKLMNGGREYIEVGGLSINNLPRDVKMEIMSPSTELDHFVKYRENNANDIRALGGEFSGDETAGKSDTQSTNEAVDKAAKMLSIVNNIEAAYKRLLAYCAMFSGLVNQDSVEKYAGDINLSLNKEFAKTKAPVEDARFVVTELRMSGLFDDETIMNILKRIGYADDIDIERALDIRDGGGQ